MWNASYGATNPDVCIAPWNEPRPRWPVVSPSLEKKKPKSSQVSQMLIFHGKSDSFPKRMLKKYSIGLLERNLLFQWKLSHQFPHFYSRNCLGWLCAHGPGSGSDHWTFDPTSNPKGGTSTSNERADSWGCPFLRAFFASLYAVDVKIPCSNGPQVCRKLWFHCKLPRIPPPGCASSRCPQ